MNADSEPFPLPLPLSNGLVEKQSNNVVHDRYTYSIDSNKQMIICYYLNQNNVWEWAANVMGYSDIDIIVSFHQKSFPYSNNLKIDLKCSKFTHKISLLIHLFGSFCCRKSKNSLRTSK